MTLSRLYLAFKILLPVAVAAVFALIVDWPEFTNRLATLEPSWAAIAVAFMLGQSLLAALRWHLLINMLQRFRRLLATVLIYHASVFVNQVLPASVGGDVLRIVWLREIAVPGSVCAASVFFERLAMLAALAVAVLIVQGLVIVQSGLPDILVFVLPLVIAMLVAGTIVLMPLARRLAVSLGLGTLAEWLATTLALIRKHMADPRLLVASPVLGFLGVLMFCAVMYSVVRATGGQIGMREAVTIGPLVLLASTLPISLGGWGAREGATAALFVLFERTATEGVLVGLSLSVVVLLSSLPGGVALLLLNRPWKTGRLPSEHGHHDA